jgi:hypothetical protein
MKSSALRSNFVDLMVFPPEEFVAELIALAFMWGDFVAIRAK